MSKNNRFHRFLRILGPELITGAADDDPSGIVTYSPTGAQFGYGQLWTAVYAPLPDSSPKSLRPNWGGDRKGFGVVNNDRNGIGGSSFGGNIG